MDDGELEFSNHDMFPNLSLGDLPSSCYVGSFFDGNLTDNTPACTHTHTCNPSGPDNSHTHTCYHVHTKTLPAPSEDKPPTNDTAESTEKRAKKRPLGNREAVRKYREKKKANAASLEDEVVKLRDLSQHLMKRLQGQAVLEAENARLKCLLVDIRGRIEGEIGSFPYQKLTIKSGDVCPNLVNSNLPAAYLMNPCKIQCNDQLYCLRPGAEGKSTEGASLNGEGVNDCEFENLPSFWSQSSGLKELPGCGMDNVVPPANTSKGNKRKGVAQTGTAG